MQRLRIPPGSWHELSRLLDEALDRPPQDRTRWIEQLEHCDQGLKQRLREVLSNASRLETHDFLQALPTLRLTSVDLPGLHAHLHAAGDCLGPYRLIRELGEGGMGSVWLAERSDGLIKRPVAMKLPHVWRLAGFMERIARERAILATLDHPNIARLYDAGVAAGGQPYLALEYVEGRPIDEYARSRGLDVPQRLQVFRQVAKAVAYAHTKLVVHRDLKPANIYVTVEGQVRLLDFGIAKLLDEGVAETTQLTRVAGIPLTPDYASPEQIAGEPVSTASDVYALGVVLYELLTGSRPYRLKRNSRGALEDAILQSEPARPSDVVDDERLRRRLRGDLDTIILKALRKSPDERYATVDALVDDLDRHVANRPVHARPHSWRYRCARFVRRNRFAAGASAAILTALLAGASVALWQAGVARAEQRRAEEVKDFLASIVRDADPYQGSGRALSAADLMREARRRVDALRATPEMRVELLTLIGSSLLNLEDLDTAENAARQALAESLAALGPDHGLTRHARVLMVGVHRFRGRTTAMQHELDEVERTLTDVDEIDVTERLELLEARAHLAIDAGRVQDAMQQSREAYDLALAAFGERSAHTAAAATLLAESYEYSDVTPEFALAAAERAFRLTGAVRGSDTAHPEMIIARDVYGRALARAGRVAEGVQHMQHALRDAVRVFGERTPSVAFIAGNLAIYQRQLGELRPAIENLSLSLAIHREHTRRDSFTYLNPLASRGIALLAARRIDEALDDLTGSAFGLRKLLGADNEETLIAEFHRALALAYSGRFAESQAVFVPVLEQYRTTYRDPVYLPYRALSAAGIAARLAGEADAALKLHEEALASVGSGANTETKRAAITAELGFDHLELGKPAKARELLAQVVATHASSTLPPTPARIDVLVGLGRAELALGSPRSALAYLQRADEFWRDFDPDNRWAGEAAWWLGRCQLALGHPRQARAALVRAADVLVRSPLPADAALVASARH